MYEKVPGLHVWCSTLLNKILVANSALLVVLSLIIGIFLVEISLRIFNLGYGHRPLESHPVLHHVHPRSYVFVAHGPSDEFGGHLVSYDQHGLVSDPEGGVAKEANCRIAFLGDSFTESRQVTYKKSFVGLLDSTTDCAVRNYGVSSYSPIFYYLQWMHAVRQWQPDVVFVQLFSNDILSDDRYFSQAKLGADSKPVAIPGFPNGWFVRQLRKSFVLRLLRKVQLTVEWTISNWGDPKSVVGGFVEENPDISKKSSDMLILLNQEVGDMGAELVLFAVPSKFRLQKQDRTYTELEFADKSKAWASDQGIKYIDLVRPFENAVLLGESVFFEKDIHFSEEGHAIVASTIQRTYPAVFRSD